MHTDPFEDADRQDDEFGDRCLDPAPKFMLSLDEVIDLASKHARCNSSELRLHDACSLRERGNLDDARRAAVASLKHSVGVLHSDFSRAVQS